MSIEPSVQGMYWASGRCLCFHILDAERNSIFWQPLATPQQHHHTHTHTHTASIRFSLPIGVTRENWENRGAPIFPRGFLPSHYSPVVGEKRDLTCPSGFSPGLGLGSGSNDQSLFHQSAHTFLKLLGRSPAFKNYHCLELLQPGEEV